MTNSKTSIGLINLKLMYSLRSIKPWFECKYIKRPKINDIPLKGNYLIVQ